MKPRGGQGYWLDGGYWRDPEQQRLAEFYAAHTKDELIAEMYRHIEKLQAKLTDKRRS